MTITLSGSSSQTIQLAFRILNAVRTPDVLLLQVWPLPLSLATTSGISFDFSSSGYLDVSVPRVPHIQLLIHCMFHDSSSWVFPHSEICGSMLICSSPQLIAACHVLHRLPMPRHSPYALLRLNYFCISGDILSVLVFSRLNCCVFHTCSLRLFIVFGKIVSFYPLRKNLISIRRFYSAVYDF